MFKRIRQKLSYEIEIVTHLIAVALIAIEYGIMEAKWIDTGKLSLPLLGRFSYYHVCLVILMATAAFTLCLTHIQWMASKRKLYVLWASLAGIPLALWLEDLTWFVARWQPIAYDEWTMIAPGLGLNVGFTWIPLWYFVAAILSFGLYWLANRSATKGYRSWQDRVLDFGECKKPWSRTTRQGTNADTHAFSDNK